MGGILIILSVYVSGLIVTDIVSRGAEGEGLRILQR